MFKGVYTALITPFNTQGEVDEDGLRQLLSLQQKGNVDGVVVLGTTGEAPTLNNKEKARVITIAREELNKDTQLIVGTGSYSTAQAIENTLVAESLGTDAVLICTPYYNKPTQEGLYQHYKAIAAATALPIIVYNIQGRTGLNMQTDTLKRLAAIPTIVGVKEASGNIVQVGEVIEYIKSERSEFSVLSGDDALLLPFMALGGDGVISVASNLVPGEIKDFYNAAANGRFEEARALHYELMPLFRALFIETNPIPIKAAMEFCSLPAGGCRLPLCPLMTANKEKLRHVIEGRQKAEGRRLK